ncbi:MAG: acyltransferase family protein [Lachnospiraceae bacterium]|nr:acyltransferase family protein [Lachnospiraceae bacterium]
MERKYYIDNLRSLAILLLFPFHAAQIWSGGEYSGFYIWSHTNTFLYVFSTAVYPWYMTLLFAIAGMSCKYALLKRTSKQFVVERVKKLIVPFFFGVLVFVPVMTYTAEVFFNGYTGSYWQQYGLFFTKETDLTEYHGGFTPAHLWFLLYLFIISLTALLIILLQKRHLPEFRVSSVSYFFIILLFVPEWLCQYVLNIGGKSLGQFMILFLFGYYILSEENILQRLKQYRFISLAICILSGSVYTYLYCFENVRNICITGLYIFFGWMGIITLLGIGQSALNFHNRLSIYLTQASFPIYILHMPALVVTGFFVLKIPVGVAGQFLLIVLISFIAAFIMYEIVKRVPALRFCLGIPKRKA